MRLELLLLFRAACLAREGSKPPPPVVESDDPTDAGLLQLLALPVSDEVGQRRYLSPADKRRRRVHAALRRLADPRFRLLSSAAATGPRRYQGLEMLREDQDPATPDRSYRVPRFTETTFALPITFFTNGWVNVLSDREIVAYLMLIVAGGFDRTVQVPAEARVRRFGLGPDAYKQLQLLEDFGLLSHPPDEGRGPTGVFDFGKGGRPIPHSWSLHAEGLDQVALDVVRRTLPGED